MSERPSTKHNIQRDETNLTRPNFSIINQLLIVTNPGIGSLGMTSTGIDPGTGLVTIYNTGTFPVDPDFRSYVGNGDILTWSEDDLWWYPFSWSPGNVNGPVSSASGTIAVFGDTTGKLLADSGNYPGRMFVPFGVFAATSPMSVAADPYGASIDRNMTPITLSFTFNVATTNNGSHYWRIRLLALTGGTVATVNTDTATADVWTQKSTTSFSISPLGASNVGLYVEVDKVGSPGPIYLFGPIFEVKV